MSVGVPQLVSVQWKKILIIRDISVKRPNNAVKGVFAHYWHLTPKEYIRQTVFIFAPSFTTFPRFFLCMVVAFLR